MYNYIHTHILANNYDKSVCNFWLVGLRIFYLFHVSLTTSWCSNGLAHKNTVIWNKDIIAFTSKVSFRPLVDLRLNMCSCSRSCSLNMRLRFEHVWNRRLNESNGCLEEHSNRFTANESEFIAKWPDCVGTRLTDFHSLIRHRQWRRVWGGRSRAVLLAETRAS